MVLRVKGIDFGSIVVFIVTTTVTGIFNQCVRALQEWVWYLGIRVLGFKVFRICGLGLWGFGFGV